MRTALYFTPAPDHPLSITAAGWLGRDAHTSEICAHPNVLGLDRDTLHAATAFPRRYGFHGTLKAPFMLAEGCALPDLERALAAFCRDSTGFTLPGLKIGRLGQFFALVPATVTPDLAHLAASLVRDFDDFRAPMTDEDFNRRNPESLSSRQRANLVQWGYPYVLDEFRYHMTLTGPVSDIEADGLEEVLHHVFADHLGIPLAIDAVSLFVERDPPSPFVVHRRFPLA